MYDYREAGCAARRHVCYTVKDDLCGILSHWQVELVPRGSYVDHSAPEGLRCALAIGVLRYLPEIGCTPPLHEELAPAAVNLAVALRCRWNPRRRILLSRARRSGEGCVRGPSPPRERPVRQKRDLEELHGTRRRRRHAQTTIQLNRPARAALDALLSS